MPRKFACVALALVIFALSVPGPLRAGIGASFDLDDCSWNATHILLVRTTAKGSVFSVVESWKGDLKPNEIVNVPELKPENAVPISRYPIPRQFDFSHPIIEQIPRQPVGSRMILFLKKEQGPLVRSTAEAKWATANRWGGIRHSAVWIDGGEAFCFQQVSNPGPSALGPCAAWELGSPDAGAITARIHKILRTQRDLSDALALTRYPDSRADRLGRIALGDVYDARNEALDALGKSGTVALPEILQVMDQPSYFYDGAALLRAFVQAAGQDSGKQLHARLQQDVLYWKALGPTLTQDWWGQLIEPGSALFMKFNETVLLVEELDKERYAPAAQTVRELRNFWVSQPQLYDSKWGEDGKNGEIRTRVSGLDQVRSESYGLAEQCSTFLTDTETSE